MAFGGAPAFCLAFCPWRGSCIERWRVWISLRFGIYQASSKLLNSLPNKSRKVWASHFWAGNEEVIVWSAGLSNLSLFPGLTWWLWGPCLWIYYLWFSNNSNSGLCPFATLAQTNWSRSATNFSNAYGHLVSIWPFGEIGTVWERKYRGAAMLGCFAYLNLCLIARVGGWILRYFCLLIKATLSPSAASPQAARPIQTDCGWNRRCRGGWTLAETCQRLRRFGFGYGRNFVFANRRVERFHFASMAKYWSCKHLFGWWLTESFGQWRCRVIH